MENNVEEKQAYIGQGKQERPLGGGNSQTDGGIRT